MINGAVSVNILARLCLEQIKKGNGEKQIVISSDDEGNSYHTLFFGFTDKPEMMKELSEYGLLDDDNDPTEIVVLG